MGTRILYVRLINPHFQHYRRWIRVYRIVFIIFTYIHTHIPVNVSLFYLHRFIIVGHLGGLPSYQQTTWQECYKDISLGKLTERLLVYVLRDRKRQEWVSVRLTMKTSSSVGSNRGTHSFSVYGHGSSYPGSWHVSDTHGMGVQTVSWFPTLPRLQVVRRHPRSTLFPFKVSEPENRLSRGKS